MIKILDFYAEWCGPCKMVSPILEEFQKETGIEVEKIDVDENIVLSATYNIMSVPTLVLLKDRKEVKRHCGFIPKEKLKEFVNI